MAQNNVPNHDPKLRLNIFDRLAKRAVVKALPFMDDSSFESTGQLFFHDQDAELRATVEVHRSSFFKNIALGGSLAAAEAYMRGEWKCDDLTSLIRIFIRNAETADRLDEGFARIVNFGHRLFHRFRSNSRTGSKKNIEAHYDLGNDFFRLWLDETMAYSSGIFLSRDATLREASEEKFDRACRKLELNAHDHLLEIGTGWGGLALHAAQKYGCHVTTTTISNEQLRTAKHRVNQAGLTKRIQLLNQDYRNLTGQYDKLISIEMIEAVGYKYYDSFFKKCGELLKPDGSFVMQAIVMPERRYAQYLRSVEFIQRYIFPGGCLPSMTAILESIGRTTDLRLVHVEDFTCHYAETLRRWKSAFDDRIDEVRAQGYSEQFIRMWEYYLCYCEALFEERYVSLYQIQFDKPQCRRDSMMLTEKAARSAHRPKRYEHSSANA